MNIGRRKMFKVEDIKVGEDFFFILGPCVIEEEKIVFQIAETLKNLSSELKIKIIFKASFDKANRSSIESYRGPGMADGLEILRKVKKIYELPITTDIHLPEQAKPVSEIVDLIQIPAFLSRQTDLLLAAGKTGKPINVKKAQFIAPWDVFNIAEKIKSTGNNKIIFTERGSSFGHNNLVVDMTSIPIIKKGGYPVIIDATHSVQKPGGLGKSSGGNRELAPYIAKAGVAVGADAVFMEVHPEPEKALSDGPNSIKLSDLKEIIKEILKVREAVL